MVAVSWPHLSEEETSEGTGWRSKGAIAHRHIEKVSSYPKGYRKILKRRLTSSRCVINTEIYPEFYVNRGKKFQYLESRTRADSEFIVFFASHRAYAAHFSVRSQYGQ